MFKRMEIAEEICKGGAPFKNNQRAEADRYSFYRKQKGGLAASPSNPKKCRTGKRKTIVAGHPRNSPNSAKKTYMLHGHRNSSEEYKVIHD